MNFYIVAGMLLIIIASFATWGYLQQYRDLRRQILEDRETEALVQRLVHGEGVSDDSDSIMQPGAEAD